MFELKPTEAYCQEIFIPTGSIGIEYGYNEYADALDDAKDYIQFRYGDSEIADQCRIRVGIYDKSDPWHSVRWLKAAPDVLS